MNMQEFVHKWGPLLKSSEKRMIADLEELIADETEPSVLQGELNQYKALFNETIRTRDALIADETKELREALEECVNRLYAFKKWKEERRAVVQDGDVVVPIEALFDPTDEEAYNNACELLKKYRGAK